MPVVLGRRKQISGSAAPGYSSGSAINAINEVAKKTLPRGYGIGWAGGERLIRIIQGEGLNDASLLLESKLITRQSSM